MIFGICLLLVKVVLVSAIARRAFTIIVKSILTHVILLVYRESQHGHNRGNAAISEMFMRSNAANLE